MSVRAYHNQITNINNKKDLIKYTFKSLFKDFERQSIHRNTREVANLWSNEGEELVEICSTYGFVSDANGTITEMELDEDGILNALENETMSKECEIILKKIFQELKDSGDYYYNMNCF